LQVLFLFCNSMHNERSVCRVKWWLYLCCCVLFYWTGSVYFDVMKYGKYFKFIPQPDSANPAASGKVFSFFTRLN